MCHCKDKIVKITNLLVQEFNFCYGYTHATRDALISNILPKADISQ